MTSANVSLYTFVFPGHSASGTRMLLCCSLMLVGIFLTAIPLSARILKTRTAQTEAYDAELPLTIGSSFEFQADSEEKEYGFPFFAEWAFTEELKLTVEPKYVVIRSKTADPVNAWEDLETALEYEALAETRNWPAFALEGIVKWPTGTNDQISSGKADYTIGGIVSKELGPMDVDTNIDYTFIGSPPGLKLKDILEISFSAEWHLNPTIDLVGEVVWSSGGGFSGKPGTIGYDASDQNSGSEAEVTFGAAEHLSKYLKLEQGVTLVTDGSWQGVIAWEYAFSGD